MTKQEAIEIHQALVAERKKLIARNASVEIIHAHDQLIGRYGNVYNPKIATKAAQYIGL